MEQNNNFKWYILNVMAGQEKKIADSIKTITNFFIGILFK